MASLYRRRQSSRATDCASNNISGWSGSTTRSRMSLPNWILILAFLPRIWTYGVESASIPVGVSVDSRESERPSRVCDNALTCPTRHAGRVDYKSPRPFRARLLSAYLPPPGIKFDKRNGLIPHGPLQPAISFATRIMHHAGTSCLLALQFCMLRVFGTDFFAQFRPTT